MEIVYTTSHPSVVRARRALLHPPTITVPQEADASAFLTIPVTVAYPPPIPSGVYRRLFQIAQVRLRDTIQSYFLFIEHLVQLFPFSLLP